MIEKKTVCQIVDEWLEGKDYFLVEVNISPDNKIVVEIDHKEGVWIEDCVELSRFIESKLNREDEDYEPRQASGSLSRCCNNTSTTSARKWKCLPTTGASWREC